jgi:hypothetical protein
MGGSFDLHLCLLACQAITEDYRRERECAQASDAIIRMLAGRYRETLDRARRLFLQAGYCEPIPEPRWVTEALMPAKEAP